LVDWLDADVASLHRPGDSEYQQAAEQAEDEASAALLRCNRLCWHNDDRRLGGRLHRNLRRERRGLDAGTILRSLP